MERLTEKINETYLCNTSFEVCEKQNRNPNDDECCCHCEIRRKMINKLGEYEEAEEQGLLLRLPVPIGTKVYTIDSECEGDPYDCHHCCDSCACNVFDVYIHSFDTWMLDDIGKTVFLTKEEAEKKLAEMKEV